MKVASQPHPPSLPSTTGASILAHLWSCCATGIREPTKLDTEYFFLWVRFQTGEFPESLDGKYFGK